MKRLFFVVAAVIIGSQLQAQDTTGTSMDEVILTANKYPKKQSETGKVITVINRQQIEKNGGKTLVELLNTVSGTTMIGANNNLGTNITASIRGASGGNVLILLDGIPANDPSVITNYFDLNFINLDQVERIEILKGGQSTLYGSDAVAGVINIISKKAIGKTTVNGSFTGGTYHTLKQSLGIGGNAKTVDYSVNYTHLSSDGFSTAYDKNNTGTFDKDGYNQHAVTGKFGFKAGKRIKTNLFGTYSKYKTDLDLSAFKDEGDYTVDNNNKQFGAGTVYTFNKGEVHANYNYNRSERDYLNGSLYVPDSATVYSKANYIGRSHFAELYGSYKLNNWEFLIGGDYRFNNTDQSYYSNGKYGPYSPKPLNAKMNQVSTYASVIYKTNTGFNLEAGSRLNFHSEYGNNVTFTLNPSYLINKKIKIFGNLYSAYKTPTLYQLFDLSAGNKDLTPEKGIIGEAGVELFSKNSFHARVVGFYRNTKDAIVYTFNPSNYKSKYLNAGKQTNYGAELEAGYIYGKLHVTANYTYTNGKTTAAFDGTGSPLGKDTSYFNLYRIPKHAINLNAGVQATKALFISVQIHSVSKREEFIYGGSPGTLKDYSLIDLYSEYKFDKSIKVFLDLKNITNKKYFDFLGYNARRFNFVTGITFQL